MACRDREKMCSVRNVCREGRGRTAAFLPVAMATREVSGRQRGHLEQVCPGTEPGGCLCPHHVYPCLLGTSSKTQPWDKVFSCICSFGSLQLFAYRQERAMGVCTTSLHERVKAAVLHKCLSWTNAGEIKDLSLLAALGALALCCREPLGSDWHSFVCVIFALPFW